MSFARHGAVAGGGRARARPSAASPDARPGAGARRGGEPARAPRPRRTGGGRRPRGGRLDPLPHQPGGLGRGGPAARRTAERDDEPGSCLHAEQTIEIGGQRAAAVVSRGCGPRSCASRWREPRRGRGCGPPTSGRSWRGRGWSRTAREALVAKLLDAVQGRVQGGASSDVDLELARLERGMRRAGPGSTRRWRRPTRWRGCGCWSGCRRRGPLDARRGDRRARLARGRPASAARARREPAAPSWRRYRASAGRDRRRDRPPAARGDPQPDAVRRLRARSAGPGLSGRRAGGADPGVAPAAGGDGGGAGRARAPRRGAGAGRARRGAGGRARLRRRERATTDGRAARPRGLARRRSGR